MEVNPKTVHEEPVTTLGSNASSYITLTRWPKCFHDEREDVNDNSRSASPLSKFTGESIELVRQFISNDPHSTYNEIIAETSLSHSTIERIIHDCLKMKKVRSRWVPYQLTDEQKQEPVKLCNENLVKFQNGS